MKKQPRRKMTALPPLDANQPLNRLTTPDYTLSPPLTFRPVATKAEKYVKLMQIDEHLLQRPKAHFKNALKTTEALERITRELQQRLEGLQGSEAGISFERLSAFRDAFNEIIKLNHTYGPQLQQIKEAYNEYIHLMLSQQVKKGQLGSPGCSIPWYGQARCSDLDKLKKRVHELEVESRVLLHENERLSKELDEEVSRHDSELERIRREGEEAIQAVEAEPPPLKDYAAKVRELREAIFMKQDEISQEFRDRNESVPLTVCNNLEQCLREVEIETQKHYRRNQRLREEIKKLENNLFSGLKEKRLYLTCDLGDVLGLT